MYECKFRVLSCDYRTTRSSICNFRQESQRTAGAGSGSSGSDGRFGNFQSLPWEEIILPPNMTSFAREKEMKQQQSSKWLSQAKSMFTGGGKDSSKRQQADPADLITGSKNGHWFLREKSPAGVAAGTAVGGSGGGPSSDLHSMPPVGTLKDSGIGDDGGGGNATNSANLSRTGTGRSSFGIILKDKFQRNPNVYFPKEDKANSCSSEDCGGGGENEEGEGGSDVVVVVDDADEGDDDDAGSSFYGEKECSMSSSSGKGSSMSPHNSMEGSPRLLFSPPSTSSNATEVVMGKKTIRNYMPKESGNMLRELENQRKNRRDLIEENGGKTTSGKPENKTSVERMIEDFHRSLPHPGAAKEPDGRSTATSTVVSKRNGVLMAAAAPGPNNNGTITSQMSNWSAGSSVASFDYLQVSKG